MRRDKIYYPHLNNNLLRLVDHLLDPLLDLLLGIRRRRVLLELLATGLSGLDKTSDVAQPPGVPLGDVSLPLRELLGGTPVLLGRVVLVEGTRELLEVESDLALVVLGQQRVRSRSPEELLELVLLLRDELGTGERPDLVSRLGLFVSSGRSLRDCKTHARSPR